MWFKIINIIVKQVEYLYSYLVDVLVDELFDGETDPDQGVAIQAFCIFVVLAVFSFYMDFFVDVYTSIAALSLVICQFSNFKNKKIQEIKDDAAHFSSIQIARGYFESFKMVLFLIVLSNFLPKAGHFILFWCGPLLGIQVPDLTLDLSFTGIWSIFAVEMAFFDLVDISLLITSFLYSMACWHKTTSIDDIR